MLILTYKNFLEYHIIQFHVLCLLLVKIYSLTVIVTMAFISYHWHMSNALLSSIKNLLRFFSWKFSIQTNKSKFQRLHSTHFNKCSCPMIPTEDTESNCCGLRGLLFISTRKEDGLVEHTASKQSIPPDSTVLWREMQLSCVASIDADFFWGSAELAYVSSSLLTRRQSLSFQSISRI